MHALRSRWLARASSRTILAVVASAVIALALAPAAPAQTTPLHLTVRYLDFTSYECRPDQPLVCDVTSTGPVNSNLSTTQGRADYTVVLYWEGFEGSPCNTVDETTVFTFDTGTVTTHSYHRDCPATIRPGPRIQTTFTVTGGTGAFAGATGSGRQVNTVYNGTIVF
jgi:hypothetical protein